MSARSVAPASRAAAGAALLATVLLVACRNGAGLPATSSSPPPTSPAALSSAAASHPAPASGRPYDGAAILDAMRESRRPGGVPDALQTEEIAGKVADAIWTWDGTAWQEMTVGAACGPARCTLDVAGSPAASVGTDLYSFAVDTGAGTVDLVTTDLHGYPPELDAHLDHVARAGVPPEDLEGLALVGARWLPPPDEGRYWLAYRSGGEEGTPGLDVLVDLGSGEVLAVEDVG